MTWKTDSIRFADAQRIFDDVRLTELKNPINGLTIGYSAVVNGQTLRNISLTQWCCEIRELERAKHSLK